MEIFVLSFGMVVILIIDADSRFKSIFKDMCAVLGIIYWPLAFGNQKSMSVEKYHLFLNKIQAIAGQYRDTHDVFLRHAKTSQYACNSAPTDGTDILRIFAAVSR